MIAVIDYGMGNLGSVANALKRLGAETRITQDAADLKTAEKIVLPGVGAFRDAVDSLGKLKLTEALKEALASGKIYLGICLGLEVLFDKSEEGGGCSGLGVIKGSVLRFGSAGFKVPHIGWNNVRFRKRECPLFKGIPDNAHFYFVHSYYVKPADGSIEAASTEYGGDFTSMVWKDNIYATQFHPEKSQRIGLKLLENFVRL